MNLFLFPEDPLAVEPLAVDPLAVDPLAVDPLADDPLAVDPLAVDPLAIDPLTIKTELKAEPSEGPEEPTSPENQEALSAPGTSASTAGSSGKRDSGQSARQTSGLAREPAESSSAGPSTSERGVGARDVAKLEARVWGLERLVTQQGRDITRILNLLERPSDATAAVFRSGRSISALQKAANQHLVAVQSENMLYCDVCAEPPAADQRSHGLFRYDFRLGDAFPNGTVIPVGFKQMRITVRKHFASKNHLKNIKKMREREKALAASGDNDRYDRYNNTYIITESVWVD